MVSLFLGEWRVFSILFMFESFGLWAVFFDRERSAAVLWGVGWSGCVLPSVWRARGRTRWSWDSFLDLCRDGVAMSWMHCLWEDALSRFLPFLAILAIESWIFLPASLSLMFLWMWRPAYGWEECLYTEERALKTGMSAAGCFSAELLGSR